MGKAKALRLGITKGIQHVGSVVLPKTYKCPVCKNEFKAYDVAVQAKETGETPEMIVAGHIKACIQSRFPNQKSECWRCKEEGKTTKLKISELDKHLLDVHEIDVSKIDSDADNPDSNSGFAEMENTLVTNVLPRRESEIGGSE